MTTHDFVSGNPQEEPAPWPKPGPAPRNRRAKAAGERWEDHNVRRTFHLPLALAEQLDAEVAGDEYLSLSAAVRDALIAWIAERQPTGGTKQ